MDRFEALRQRYAASSPRKAEHIDAAWKHFVIDPANVDARIDFYEAVHRLSGSAAAYGFEELGDLAQGVHIVFSDWLGQPAYDGLALTQSLRTLSAGVTELLVALRTHRVVG